MKNFYFKAFPLLILIIFISGRSFSISSANQTNKTIVVVIDPGHGGKDPGAVNKDIREKDVVLGIGLKLGKYLNEKFPDVKVIFTRNTDVFVPLIDRSRIANKNKADLFICIHANFCGTPATKGTETFVLGVARSNENLDVAKRENSVILREDNYETTYEGFDPNSSESYIMFAMAQETYMKQSLAFADDIQRQFHSRINSLNRGPKQAGFLVLRQSSMPSVLIETGFISNPNEANYLKSEEGQQSIALSILEAFRNFKTRNSGKGTSVVAEAKSSPIKHPAETNNRPDTATKKIIAEQKQDSNLTEKQIVSVENHPSVKENNSSTKRSAIKPEQAQPKTEKPAIVPKAINSKETNKSTNTNSEQTVVSADTYFSVQIGANTTSVEPNAANFKGLKNVRREKSDKYYRYYIGKESSLEKITPIWQQIKTKFSQAFIVSFVDGKRIIINTTSN